VVKLLIQNRQQLRHRFAQVLKVRQVLYDRRLRPEAMSVELDRQAYRLEYAELDFVLLQVRLNLAELVTGLDEAADERLLLR